MTIYCRFCYGKCKNARKIPEGTAGYLGEWYGYSMWEYPPDGCWCFT